MTRQAAVVMGLGAVALVVASVFASPGDKDQTSAQATEVVQPVSDDLAAKAQSSCWFKVKNRSSRADEVRRWAGVTSTGATTERLGELLIVSGAMSPAVKDNQFYGCAMFEYTAGSPVVLMATASPSPVRADTVIPYGFSRDGHKQLQ